MGELFFEQNQKLILQFSTLEQTQGVLSTFAEFFKLSLDYHSQVESALTNKELASIENTML